MDDTNVQINFDASATLRKWPPSKMSVLAPPMVDAHIQYLRALWTIASGNSWQSLQASVTYMKYTLLRKEN
jgi:hypothetical protein